MRAEERRMRQSIAMQESVSSQSAGAENIEAMTEPRVHLTAAARPARRGESTNQGGRGQRREGIASGSVFAERGLV